MHILRVHANDQKICDCMQVFQTKAQVNVVILTKSNDHRCDNADRTRIASFGMLNARSNLWQYPNVPIRKRACD